MRPKTSLNIKPGTSPKTRPKTSLNTRPETSLDTRLGPKPSFLAPCRRYPELYPSLPQAYPGLQRACHKPQPMLISYLVKDLLPPSIISLVGP
ncbi:hypothetical protein PV326_009964 [Microctonus aethiopoides]|nr:hypothetical protein PV326_009964 [Microctonus aethiopoides]